MLRSTEAHAALLVALSDIPGLKDLDLACCPLFTAAHAPDPVVNLPALRSLQVSVALGPSHPCRFAGLSSWAPTAGKGAPYNLAPAHGGHGRGEDGLKQWLTCC